MGNYYLVADINEKGGYHVLGWLKNGKIEMEEVYRFEVKYIKGGDEEDKKQWDLEYIFEQIKAGLATCRKLGKLPVLVGITTCDDCFVLLDMDNKPVDNMIYSFDFPETLDAIRNNYPDDMKENSYFLMLADYFNFLLTGKMQCNYTRLPCKLISADTRDWNEEYITEMGFDKFQFPSLVQPGKVVGNLTLKVTEEVGYDFIVIQVLSRRAGKALFNTSAENSLCDGMKDDKDINDINIKDSNQNNEKERKINKYNISEELKSVIGDLCILFMTSHELKDLDEAKECIRNTFCTP